MPTRPDTISPLPAPHYKITIEFHNITKAVSGLQSLRPYDKQQENNGDNASPQQRGSICCLINAESVLNRGFNGRARNPQVKKVEENANKTERMVGINQMSPNHASVELAPDPELNPENLSSRGFPVRKQLMGAEGRLRARLYHKNHKSLMKNGKE
ncbi:hypothetical protein Aduo_017006 [Ancylostoma duodenale]